MTGTVKPELRWLTQEVARHYGRLAGDLIGNRADMTDVDRQAQRVVIALATQVLRTPRDAIAQWLRIPPVRVERLMTQHAEVVQSVRPYGVRYYAILRDLRRSKSTVSYGTGENAHDNWMRATCLRGDRAYAKALEEAIAGEAASDINQRRVTCDE